MDTVTTNPSTSASVFEASTKDPQVGVTLAVAEVSKLLAKYTEAEDVLVRMQLLSEVEALRRFVLVRGALLKAMQQTGSNGKSIGRELCDSLRGMIGEVPELVKTWPSSEASIRPSSNQQSIAGSALRRPETGQYRKANQRCRVGNPELLKNVCTMRFNSALADAKGLGDLLR